MKKWVLALAAAFAALALFAGCAKKDDGPTVSVVLPDGSTAIALAQLFEEPEVGGYRLDFQLSAGAEPVKAALINGTADIAVVPANLAAALYNAGKSSYRYAATVGNCNLYLVSKESLAQLSDLAGKTVVAIGQGQVPDLVFRHILAENNLTESVTLEYRSEGGDIVAGLAAGNIAFGLLAEPAVTQALTKVDGAEVALRIEEEWAKLPGKSVTYPQAVLVVKDSLAEGNPGLVEQLLAKVEESCGWSNANPGKVGAALAKGGSAYAKVAYNAEVLARMNVAYSEGDAAKSRLTAFYEVIKPAIGNKLPDEGFYY